MAAPIITCVEDLRLLARRRVPKMFYDYADSGAWSESTYRANETDFQRIHLRQRVAVDMSNRTLASSMIGQPVSMPVALAPVGLTGTPTVRCWPPAPPRRRGSPSRSQP
jgi:L-lactate dehydrogenase (cytochrome)